MSDESTGIGVRAVGGALVAATLTLGLIGGCKSGSNPSASGSSSPSTSASGSPSGSSSASPSPSGPTGTVGPSRTPPASTPPAGSEETHRGTIRRGVEPGCLILHSPDGQFELVGANPRTQRLLTPNATVVVHGYRQKGMMSHCMQGTIFKVVSAERAG